ncbi:MAG: UDP-N-acetylglucosamine 2-epimerase [Bacteriovorax sp.]|nr:UDP-N-acetylglucosamine 2-epimerase [Bacteriovorax sp.]
MKKILAITTIRSDYDLMSGLYKLLNQDPEINFQLLVAGAHLSRNYGHTVDLIKKDGFSILAEIENLIDSDSTKSRLKTASILLQNSIDVVDNFSPDLILYAGDREDVLIGGMLSTYLQIPSIHFFGGDHEKDGHADTVVRHATSKLSTAHIVSIEEHRKRLIKMGEAASRVFVTGSIALDKFIQHKPLNWEELKLNFPTAKNLKDYALVIYHPVDDEKLVADQYFQNILEELKSRNIPAIVSYPNTDPGNFKIIEKIKEYESDSNFWFYKNLNRDLFLSVFKMSKFIIGNSSAGIMEAASIPISAINVGLRQRGRLAGANVIFCDSDRKSISDAINESLTPSFLEKVKNLSNIYGDGKSCEKAYQIIKKTDFNKMRLKMEDPLDVT